VRTATPHPDGIVCAYCGNDGFRRIVRKHSVSYFCGSCRKKYRRPRSAGSGQIAGPVYYRTQEL
jgi:DNA-directed RNA polymerase subunit RPC12/RpoP